jgi:NhaP-type Na+/H+ or K+/H+ antiporter
MTAVAGLAATSPAYTLALGLPRSITGREDLITMTSAVVRLYVFVQTLVMIPLLHRLGVISPGV